MVTNYPGHIMKDHMDAYIIGKLDSILTPRRTAHLRLSKAEQFANEHTIPQLTPLTIIE